MPRPFVSWNGNGDAARSSGVQNRLLQPCGRLRQQMACLRRKALFRRPGSRTMGPLPVTDAAGRSIRCSAHQDDPGLKVRGRTPTRTTVCRGDPGPKVRGRKFSRTTQSGMSFSRMTISSMVLTSGTRFRSRPLHDGAEAPVCLRSQLSGIENPLTYGALQRPLYPLHRRVRLHSILATSPQVAILMTMGTSRPFLAPAGNGGRVSFRLQCQWVVAGVLVTSVHCLRHRKRRRHR